MKEKHTPWFEGSFDEKSYRSIFKWGDPTVYKHPNEKLYNLMKKTFNLNDEWFSAPQHLGLEIVEDS
ncbi:MAG TPA: hypothetical protein PK746_09510, partial [Spirochaetales bacterium]|nr:hypothetical protein [Spirochaetales bacterium]